MARPTKYTKEIGDAILEQVATTSKGLRAICDQAGISPSTFYLWLTDNKAFSEQYARVKVMQADLLAEEILQISDDGSNDYMTIVKGDKSYNVEDREVTSRSKLRVDSRKWLASKLAPKKYGDKMDVTSDGDKITSFAVGFKKLDEEG